MSFIHTEILRVGVHSALSLIVGEDIVHLYVGQQLASGHQSILRNLDHRNLLVKHAHLTEVHLSLHSREVRELLTFLAKFLKSLLKSSSEEHIYF